MAACTTRCGSFQLIHDSTKVNPVSLNDFCLENVGCPRSSLGSRCRCYREPSRAEPSLENGRVIVASGIIPAGRPTSVCSTSRRLPSGVKRSRKEAVTKRRVGLRAFNDCIYRRGLATLTARKISSVFLNSRDAR